MIPTEQQAKALWNTYHVPKEKRIHLALVAKVAVFIGERCHADTNVLLAAALLHDIDKATGKLPGERHPDAAVRILRKEGMDEVADVVVTHPLHAILDAAIAPKTIEEKILYLADKMVKYDIVGVDRRFALWRAEELPQEATEILNASYPKVKALEKEVFNMAGITHADIARLA